MATSGAGEVKALQGQVEGLGKELAAAREAAAARQREATAKEQEAAKVRLVPPLRCRCMRCSAQGGWYRRHM